MEKIIDAIPVDLIRAELIPSRKLMDTNKGGNEIYVVDCFNAPNTLREIGRIREIAYREAGGCSGKSMDLDEYDFMEKPYQQLIVWDPDAQAIIGGYRYILGKNVVLKENGQPNVTASHLFQFSDKFIAEYLPKTMELGRSFVAPEYQSSKAGAKSLYALDNLFDGIAAIGILYKKRIKYFFGKATIYTEYPDEARELIMCFLKKYFGKGHRLLKIRKEVKVERKTRRRYYRLFKGLDFKEGYRVLKAEVQRRGVSIPPLVNTYMNLSPTMIFFGTGINDEFGDVYDSGLLVTFMDMYPEKRKRHSDSFLQQGWQNIRKLLKRLQRK